MNIKNTGKTALHLSVLNNHRDVVQLLLDSDADVAAADDGGNTPLHYAAIKSVQSLSYDDSHSNRSSLYNHCRMMTLTLIVIHDPANLTNACAFNATYAVFHLHIHHYLRQNRQVIHTSVRLYWVCVLCTEIVLK